MRFVSLYPRLSLGAAVTERFVLALDGQRDRTRDSVGVFFTQDYLTPSDVQAALAHWPENAFKGRWLDEDHITLQPLPERISVYDTEEEQRRNNWDNELREHVEKFLLAKPNIGVDFIAVEAAKIPAPWRTYPKTHHSKIAPLAEELGCVDEALAYERENKNRESVIAALEALAAAPAAEGEVVHA